MKLFFTILTLFLFKISLGQDSTRVELSFHYVGDTNQFVRRKLEFKSLQIINKRYPRVSYNVPYESIIDSNGHYFITLPNKKGNWWWIYFREANMDVNDLKQGLVYFLASCSSRLIEVRYKEFEKGSEFTDWVFTPAEPDWTLTVEQLSKSMRRKQAYRILTNSFFIKASYFDGKICDIEYNGDSMDDKDKKCLIKYVSEFIPPKTYGKGFSFSLSSAHYPPH